MTSSGLPFPSQVQDLKHGKAGTVYNVVSAESWHPPPGLPYQPVQEVAPGTKGVGSIQSGWVRPGIWGGAFRAKR